MVHSKLDDEVTAGMPGMKLDGVAGGERRSSLLSKRISGERPRSGESSKSNKSSGSSGSAEEPHGLLMDLSKAKYIVLELAEHGDLFDFTLAIQEPMGEFMARHYFLQILSAVEYLHLDQKIIHRDFKLENILVDSNFNIKICDFTLAKTFAEGSIVGVFYSHVGTERYMAPEINEGKPYKGNTTDIFALGVILFILVTGVMPFQGRATKTDPLYQYIYKNDEKGYWEAIHKTYGNQSQGGSPQSTQWNFNPTFSEEFKKFIWQFFSYHYFERITLEKMRSAKWIQMHSQDGCLQSLTKESVMKEMQRRKVLQEEKSKSSVLQKMKQF